MPRTARGSAPRPCLLGLALSVLAARPHGAAAQSTGQPPPDKSGYTLFDPTPDALLRDFSTDRPNKANSPITIDAGHFQIESDLVNYTYDHWSPDDVTSRQTVYGAPTLRVGLTDWAELDLSLPLHVTLDQRSRDGGGATRAGGVGDLQLGGAFNLFGNNGGDQALGVLASVKIPTAARGLGNNMVEGAIYLPFTTALADQFSLTVEPGAGLMREASKQGYAGDFPLLLNISRPVWGKSVTASVELALDYTSDHTTGTRDTVDLALQWLVTRTLQFDMATYIGVTKAAPDLNPYVGISYRF